MATDTVKYFSGTDQLVSIWPAPLAQFVSLGGVKSRANYCDSFSRLIGRDASGALRPVTRRIFYKANPSLHKCDGRCLHAKGNNCECACGGQFHGAGTLSAALTFVEAK